MKTLTEGSKMRQDTKTRTLQSGDARNVALNFCDLHRSRSFELFLILRIHVKGPDQLMTKEDKKMDTSCSLLNSVCAIVTENRGSGWFWIVLFRHVSGKTTSKRRHSCSARACLLRGISALTCHDFKRRPAGMETRVNMAATWGFADGTKLIPSP